MKHTVPNHLILNFRKIEKAVALLEISFHEPWNAHVKYIAQYNHKLRYYKFFPRLFRLNHVKAV